MVENRPWLDFLAHSILILGVILVAFLGVAPWLALSAANALLGFAILMGARDPVAAVLPALRNLPAGPPRAVMTESAWQG